MTARLSFRFDPTTDLYLLCTDPMSIPADGWAHAWEAIQPVLTTLRARA